MPLILQLGTIAVMVLLLDQLMKAAIIRLVGPDQWPHRQELVGRFVALEYVENDGAAFGILSGKVWLLSVLALLVALGFVRFFWKDLPSNWLLRIGVGLMLGGALGNLMDRLRHGHVTDFLAVGIWPRFNLADSAISIGLLILFIAVLRDESHPESTT